MYRLRPSSGLGSAAALPTFFGTPYHCELTQNWLVNPSCWGRSTDDWGLMVRGTVAPPQAPTGDVLTVPPASGAEAQATVDALLNQQLIDQQALNAAGVQSGALDVAASGIVSAADAAAAAGETLLKPGGISLWVWGALGLGVFAVVAVSGGSPRRYGR